MQSEVMTITPEIAEKWLGQNLHNRNLREFYVAELADAIRNGEWQLNGETISFAEDGTLINGQHRLHAVIKADTPIQSLVVTGLPAEAQDTVDNGRKRTLADILKLHGETNSVVLAAAVSQAWKVDNGFIRRESRRPTPEQALKLLREKPWVRDGLSITNTLRKIFGLPGSAISGVWYQLMLVDPEACEVFFDKVASGANLEEGSPILALRKWIQTHVGDGKSQRHLRVNLHAVTIKAWNYWRQGVLVDRLNWRGYGYNAEKFPEPV